MLKKGEEDDISSTFDTIVNNRKMKIFDSTEDKTLKNLQHLKDETNFFPYEPGYSVMTGFSAKASSAVLKSELKMGSMVWDKSKKYI